MRMDDAVSIGKLEVALQTQSDFDSSTRILCQLTSDEAESEVPWQADVSVCADHRCIGVSLA